MNHKGSKVLGLGRAGMITAIAVLIGATYASHPEHSSSGEMTFITIRADQPGANVSSKANYQGGSAVSKAGDRIGVTAQYLTFDGKPWLPVMGEFHFSRYPEQEWEDEILKMKAGGIQIISTYVIWIHHQELKGHFDWSGRRDLRRFVELCGKHGLYVFVRIGPWVHGEVRNGGLPDWVLKETRTRENDPRYLSLVDKFDAEISRQLNGRLWKDGGPVIGIQIENEYSNRGPRAGSAHILELKRLALKNGLDVPLYTVTGWDNAVYPEREVLPVYGAYSDAPWDPSDQKLGPNEAYAFRFESRVSGNTSALPASAGGLPPEDAGIKHTDAVPFLTAEVGSGIQDTHHRRPIVGSDDVSAIPDVLIGSGANLLGYYMFHGGENPDGAVSTLNESRATGYPTDVPVKSYDFQAPLGEFGQERPSFRSLKLLNYFLDDFGALLAPMLPHRPALVPRNVSDVSIPRVSFRSSADGGFLFVNNFVRGISTPPRSRLQVEVQWEGRKSIIPDNPIEVPSDSYFIWPVDIELGPSHLNYSTAQLFTRIVSSEFSTYFFFVVPGVVPVFSFSGVESTAFANTSGSVERVGDRTIISNVTPGNGVAFELPDRNAGKNIRVVLLNRDQAERLTRVTLKDGVHLVSSSGEVFSDGGRLFLRSSAGPHFKFGIYPDFTTTATAEHDLCKKSLDGLFQNYVSDVPERRVALQVAPRGKSKDPRPANSSNAEDQRPNDDVNTAPHWNIQVPASSLDGLSNVFLEITYKGDAAHLSAGGKLLSDDFYNGTPWTIGLHRFAPQLNSAPLDLAIAPLQPGNDVVFDDSAGPDTSRGPVVSLVHVTAVPEYQMVLYPK